MYNSMALQAWSNAIEGAIGAFDRDTGRTITDDVPLRIMELLLDNYYFKEQVLAFDNELIEKTFSLHGVPKVMLRNSVPIDKAKMFVDDYELTPEFSYEHNKATGEIKTVEKPWLVEDDNGDSSYSLMPPPVVVSLIKQLCQSLGL